MPKGDPRRDCEQVADACIQFLTAVADYGAQLQDEDFFAVAATRGEPWSDEQPVPSLAWATEARLFATLWRVAASGNRILAHHKAHHIDVPSEQDLAPIRKLVQQVSRLAWIWDYPQILALEATFLPAEREATPKIVVELYELMQPAIRVVNDLLMYAQDPQGADRLRKRACAWRQAASAAEAHCARNPFPGVKALAELVGCSPSTMSKAIDRSDKLRSLLVEHLSQRKSVSTRAMPAATARTIEQTREQNPADAASGSTDDIFARLLACARPAERAKLNAMSPEQRRELVAAYAHDPDRPKHPRRRNAHRSR